MLFRMICVVYCSLKGSLRFVAACEALSFLVAPNFTMDLWVIVLVCFNIYLTSLL